MADAITPNIDLIKPEVTGSFETWGGKLNGNMDKIDVWSGETNEKTTRSLKRSSPETTEGIAERTADQLLFYKDAPAVPIPVDKPLALVTQKFVRDLCNALLPVGTIIMWGGTWDNVPDGWAYCNGQTSNGIVTPNMLDRFVICASPTVGMTPGAFGGSSVLNLASRVGGIVLTPEQMPYHTHGVVDQGHSHQYDRWDGGAGGVAWTYNVSPTSTRDPVKHNTTGSGTGIYLQYAGANWAHDHPVGFSVAFPQWYPLYYAVAFIMRVKAF